MAGYLWHQIRKQLWLGLTIGLSALSPMSHGAEPRVLVIGDSLSAAYGMALEQGWVNLLQQRISEKGYPHQVVNASISGDTTGGGARRLPRLMAEHTPSIVIIELGGNDGLRAFPLKIMRNNLETMADLVTESDAALLILGAEAPPNLGSRYTSRFHDTFTEVATTYGARHLQFVIDRIFLDPDLMQPDNTHPNIIAQPLLLDHVWSEIEPMLAE
jgi:acyl-CoA thioesterase-1